MPQLTIPTSCPSNVSGPPLSPCHQNAVEVNSRLQCLVEISIDTYKTRSLTPLSKRANVSDINIGEDCVHVLTLVVAYGQ